MAWLGMRGKKRPGRALPFPAGPHLRMAQLAKTAGFDSVVAFPEECVSDLQSFKPQVLVAPAQALLAAARAIFAGDLSLESIDVAIFVLIQIGDTPVPPPERDLIWRAFRVPVYELYVDSASNLLASECEAHDGWHVRSPNVQFFLEGRELLLCCPHQPPIRTGLTASCTDGRCACGDMAPLLRGVTENFRSLAASAS